MCRATTVFFRHATDGIEFGCKANAEHDSAFRFEGQHSSTLNGCWLRSRMRKTDPFETVTMTTVSVRSSANSRRSASGVSPLEINCPERRLSYPQLRTTDSCRLLSISCGARARCAFALRITLPNERVQSHAPAQWTKAIHRHPGLRVGVPSPPSSGDNWAPDAPPQAPSSRHRLRHRGAPLLAC